MGASIEPQGKPGKRSFVADLNLVPYIDLLTCMVAFLLITAVWTQLAQLKLSQRGHGEEGEPAPPLTPIAIVVGPEAMNLVVGQEREMVPSRDGQPDWGELAALLKKIKSRFPDREDMLIASDDAVLFDRLTTVMDAAIAAGFPAVSLEPGRESGL
jgi:biopolymer transport protein ExbD